MKTVPALPSVTLPIPTSFSPSPSYIHIREINSTLPCATCCFCNFESSLLPLDLGSAFQKGETAIFWRSLSQMLCFLLASVPYQQIIGETGGRGEKISKISKISGFWNGNEYKRIKSVPLTEQTANVLYLLLRINFKIINWLLLGCFEKDYADLQFKIWRIVLTHYIRKWWVL